ncbi:hypothetical protein [Salisediminibacterium halotolerans]|uniref:hypothetical protein n=1 Tax=Salisediminibacterium halotolerans TaxID=517425 RepID=UPI0013151E32|nr:hypothetical protein [Salisediminibacterium halotolerans]
MNSIDVILKGTDDDASFFESSVCIIKEAAHPLLRRLRESKRRRSGFGGLMPANPS